MATLPDVPGLSSREEKEPGFMAAFLKVASSLGFEADHFAASLSIESGFDPRALNSDSGASGLLQWMPQYLPPGLTSSELRAMTATAQLPLVEKTMSHWKGKHVAPRDVYLTIFYPDGVGRPDDHVLFTEGEKGYAQNKGLDFDHDGRITAGDVRMVADARLASSRTKPRLEVDETYHPTPAAVGTGSGILAVLGLGAFALYLFGKKRR